MQEVYSFALGSGIIYFIIELYLSSLLPVISAAAPGDEHPVCRGRVGNPSNIKALMDSRNYYTLLRPYMNPVWLPVDNDDNNEETASSVCYILTTLLTFILCIVVSGHQSTL